jgi:hypothetical protein
VENNYQYISLQEATEYCQYSQEYLSLRARQGKFKAKKIGRNWVTTKEWIKEYVVSLKQNNDENKISDSGGRQKKTIIAPKTTGDTREITKINEASPKSPCFIPMASYCVVRKEAPPPKNLPTGNFAFFPTAFEEKFIRKNFSIPFGLIFSLCVSLIIFSFVFTDQWFIRFPETSGEEIYASLQNNKNILADSFYAAGEDLHSGFEREADWIFSFPNKFINFKKYFNKENILAGVSGVERLSNLLNKKLENSVFAVGGFFMNGQDLLNKNFDKINFGTHKVAAGIDQGATSLLSKLSGGAEEAQDSLAVILENFSRVDFSFARPTFVKILEIIQVVGKSGDKIIYAVIHEPAEKLLMAFDGARCEGERLLSSIKNIPAQAIKVSDKVFAAMEKTNANAEAAFNKTIISTKKEFTLTRSGMGMAIQLTGHWFKNSFQVISELLIKPAEPPPINPNDALYNREMINSLKKEVEELRRQNSLHQGGGD